MGTWDYGLLDNDPAMDIKDLWDRVMQEPGYDHNDAVNTCFNRWGDAVNYGDTITNMEILALVALHFNSKLKLAERMVKIAIDAINRELMPEELSSWEEPEKRKKVLMTLLKKLGGEVKPPTQKKMPKDTSLTYKSIQYAKTELLKIVDEAKGMPWITYRVMRQMEPIIGDPCRVKIPPFLQTIDRYMKHRIWQKDSNITCQATVERLMMLTTYLGIWLKMSREEIMELLDRCGYLLEDG